MDGKGVIHFYCEVGDYDYKLSLCHKSFLIEDDRGYWGEGWQIPVLVDENEANISTRCCKNCKRKMESVEL